MSRLHILVLVTAALAAYLAVLALPAALQIDPAGLLLLLLLVVISEFWSINLYERSVFSITAAPILAGAALFGLPGVILTTWLGAGLRGLRRHTAWYKIVFNGSSYTLGGALAVLVFQVVRSVVEPDQIFWLLPASVIAGAGYFLHTALVALAIGLESHEHPYRIWSTHFRWLFPHYVVLAIVATMLAIAYIQFGVLGAVIFLMPALMMRYVAGAYVRQTMDYVRQLREVNAHLEATATELRRRNEQLRLLSAAGELLGASRHLEADLPAILRLLPETFSIAGGLIFYPTLSAEPLITVAHPDPAAEAPLRQIVAALRAALPPHPAPHGETTYPLAALLADQPAQATARALNIATVVAEPMLTEHGLCGWLLCFYPDPPERIAAADRLFAQELAQRIASVHERNQLVEEAARVEAYINLDRAKSEVISVVSHELRTPMTSIRGMSELILQMDPSQPEWRDMMRIVHEESVRLSDILDDLLDASRIEDGRVDLRLEPVVVPELVERCLASKRPQSPRHHFEVRYAPDLPPALADRDKLSRILDNLIGNAIKYSPNGGMVRISLGMTPDGMLEVQVADEGVGIAPEDQHRIFERFERIISNETRGIRGTGLGLYIVRNLVNRMGGEIHVESTLGKGSVFRFTLPVVAVPARR